MDIKEYARQFHGSSLPEYEIAPEPINEIPEPYALPKRKGYIYYAGDGNGRIKIGFSTNPWSRVKEMRCANPSIAILITEKVEDGISVERERHKEFKEYHLALEWFSTGDRLVRWINHLRDNLNRGVAFSNPPNAK